MRAAAVALVAWSAALQARAETAGEPEYAVRAGTTLDAYTVDVGARHAFRNGVNVSAADGGVTLRVPRGVRVTRATAGGLSTDTLLAAAPDGTLRITLTAYRCLPPVPPPLAPLKTAHTPQEAAQVCERRVSAQTHARACPHSCCPLTRPSRPPPPPPSPPLYTHTPFFCLAAFMVRPGRSSPGVAAGGGRRRCLDARERRRAALWRAGRALRVTRGPHRFHGARHCAA